jgi:hypothetical protein
MGVRSIEKVGDIQSIAISLTGGVWQYPDIGKLKKLLPAPFVIRLVSPALLYEGNYLTSLFLLLLQSSRRLHHLSTKLLHFFNIFSDVRGS